MSELLGQVDVIKDPDGWGLAVDDHRVDAISWLNPDTGLIEQKPARITPEEARQVEIDGWRKALASVERRIETFDPNGDRMPYEEPLTEEKIERLRVSLDGEKQRCLDELARLEAPAAEPTKRGRRR